MINYLSDDNWLEFEKDHVWHPYAPLEGAMPPYPVKSAQGVHLTLEDGRNLIDGMSSWWSPSMAIITPFSTRPPEHNLTACLMSCSAV